MAQQIQFRNGTAAQWTTANPVLAMGELGLENDTGQFKMGNGIDAWSVLLYGGIQGPAGANGTNGAAGATGATGPSGATHGNYDGGNASAVYGGVSPLDGGDANDI
jgi:hypothetical protein